MALLGREAEVLMQGKAAQFDGVDDYVKINDDSSLRLNHWTVEAWFKSDVYSDTKIRPLLFKGVLTKWKQHNYGLHLFGDANVRLNLRAMFGNGTTYYQITVWDITPNVWHHAVGTYDGSYLRLYLDGSEVNNLEVSTTPYTSTDPAQISRGDGYAIDGCVDEVRLYNRALTLEEIREHYQGIYQDETGLVLYLPFENNVKDYSGQGNNGVNYGATFVDGAEIPIGYARNVRVGMDASLIKIYNIESDEPDVLESAEKSFTVSIERMYLDERLAKVYLLEKKPFTLHVKPAGSGVGLELIKLLDVHLTSYSLSIEQDGLILDSVEGEASDLVFTNQ